MTLFADNFTAGALITLLIPASVLIAIAIWYTYSVLRLAATRDEGTPAVPAPTPPATSGLTTTEEGGGAAPVG